MVQADNDNLGLLNTDQMAAYLGIKPIYARQMRLSGKGPAFVKIGNHVRYRLTAIEEWLDGKTVRSTSDRLR